MCDANVKHTGKAVRDPVASNSSPSNFVEEVNHVEQSRHQPIKIESANMWSGHVTEGQRWTHNTLSTVLTTTEPPYQQ